ncbi:hypothetical protein [Streptomyces sp. NPDC005181]|uniref:hypothetical protein n=1 Tax=Streptomyces sp. NPDC005181 TaxID=3156869 RepID=UPI00339EF20A
MGRVGPAVLGPCALAPDAALLQTAVAGKDVPAGLASGRDLPDLVLALDGR